MVGVMVRGEGVPSPPALNPKAVVTALVVNYNTPYDLIRLVESADEWEPNLRWSFYQNKPPEDIDDPWRTVVDGRGSRVRLQRGEENYGHGYGINRAAEAAIESDYFFILNPDCLFTESIIDRLVEFLEADPVRAVVGPKQRDSSGRITAGGIVGTLDKPQHRFWHRRDRGDVLVRDSVKSVTVAGSAMLVRVNDFFEYGGLLESRHYYSETWFNYHLQAHGYEVWYCGAASMIHEWHRSSKIGAAHTDGFFEEDRTLFRRMCDSHDPPIPRD